MANGKNRFALTEFLREHYTTSREQAAGLSAYVLGAGFGAKPANEPPKTAKPEEETSGIPRPPKQIEEATKPEEEPAAGERPSGARGRRDQRLLGQRVRQRYGDVGDAQVTVTPTAV